MGFFGQVSKWVGKIGRSAARAFGSVGGIKGVRKTIGKVGEHAKTIGAVARKAAPIVKAVLGSRAGRMAEGVGSVAGRVGRGAGQAHRASQLAEDAASDVRSGYRAARRGNVGAAVKAGQRLRGKYRGGRRYVRG
jgi:hypothetical protein